jgi:hypothetical protein
MGGCGYPRGPGDGDLALIEALDAPTTSPSSTGLRPSGRRRSWRCSRVIAGSGTDKLMVSYSSLTEYL